MHDVFLEMVAFALDVPRKTRSRPVSSGLSKELPSCDVTDRVRRSMKF